MLHDISSSSSTLCTITVSQGSAQYMLDHFRPRTDTPTPFTLTVTSRGTFRVYSRPKHACYWDGMTWGQHANSMQKVESNPGPPAIPLCHIFNLI